MQIYAQHKKNRTAPTAMAATTPVDILLDEAEDEGVDGDDFDDGGGGLRFGVEGEFELDGGVGELRLWGLRGVLELDGGEGDTEDAGGDEVEGVDGGEVEGGLREGLAGAGGDVEGGLTEGVERSRRWSQEGSRVNESCEGPPRRTVDLCHIIFAVSAIMSAKNSTNSQT